VQIGEDTVLDLTTLECVGKKWQDVRTARNRTRRHGITMVTGQPAEFTADLRGTIERPSQAWVSGKPPPEMAFTLGTVDHALDPEKRTHFLSMRSTSCTGSRPGCRCTGQVK